MKNVQGHKMCPFCGGDVEYAGIRSGYIFPDINTGQMYLCKECGYQGSFIMEFDDPDDISKIKEYLVTNRKDIDDIGRKKTTSSYHSAVNLKQGSRARRQIE